MKKDQLEISHLSYQRNGNTSHLAASETKGCKPAYNIPTSRAPSPPYTPTWHRGLHTTVQRLRGGMRGWNVPWASAVPVYFLRATCLANLNSGGRIRPTLRFSSFSSCVPFTPRVISTASQGHKSSSMTCEPVVITSSALPFEIQLNNI